MSTTFNQSLQSTIDAIDAEVAELSSAREVIAELLAGQTNADTNGSGKSERVTKPAAKRTAKTTTSEPKARRASNGKAKATGSTQRDRIISLLRQGVKPTQVAEQLDTNPSYVYTVKKSMEDVSPAKPLTKAQKKDLAAAKKTNGAQRRNRKSRVVSETEGETKRDRIDSMLSEGVSPRDIAEQLDTNVGYVYTVKKAVATA